MSNMTEQRSDRESDRLVSALADLFDRLSPTTLAEAEEELRGAGSDPHRIGVRIEHLVRARLDEQGSAAGERRPSADTTSRWARSSWRLAWVATAALAAAAVVWALLRPTAYTPMHPDLSAQNPTERGEMLARRLPPAAGAAPERDAVDAAPPDQRSRQPEQPAPRDAGPGLEDHAAIDAAAPDLGEMPVQRVVVDVASGTVVSADNVAEHANLMSPGVLWAVRNGLRMTVVDPRPVPLPTAYRRATAQYASAVTLTPDTRSLDGYVAGLPFRTIDPNDADAGTKIMWNYEYRPFATDDFEARDLTFESGTLGVRGEGMSIERRFTIDGFQRLYANGRLYVDPRPAMPDPNGLRYRESLYPLRGPGELHGMGMITMRYLDGERQDDTWLYVPSLRRVRRLSAAQRSEALFGQDADLDSLLGFSGQVSRFSWRLVGESVVLACMHAQHAPVQWGTGRGDFAFDDEWEPRAVYVVEGVPDLSQYTYGKRVLYIDQETWAVLFADSYDRKNALWKVWLNMFGASPLSPDSAGYGGGIVSRAAVMIDTQLLHATRMTTGGRSVDGSAGWSFNQGRVTEQPFTVAAMIEAAR